VSDFAERPILFGSAAHTAHLPHIANLAQPYTPGHTGGAMAEETTVTSADSAATATLPPAGSPPTPPAQAAPPAAPGPDTATPTPAPAQGGDGSEDIYDAAFTETLGKEITSNGAAATTAVTPPAPDAASPGTELTDEQRQLLSRWHLAPEMVAQWAEDQRSQFFENAQKRETDQQASYNKVRDDLTALQTAAAAYLEQQQEGGAPPGGSGEDQTASSEGQPPDLSRVREVVDQLADVYGDDIKPLGQVLDAVNEQVGALQQQAAYVPMLNQMIAQMALDGAVNALERDYPSLSTPEARKKVVEKFEEMWPKSPHRVNSELRYLDRMREGVRDAAKELFKNTTEATAQAALLNTTKEQLLQQPPTGQGRGTPHPMTEDALYAQAFNEHLRT